MAENSSTDKNDPVALGRGPRNPVLGPAIGYERASMAGCEGGSRPGYVGGLLRRNEQMCIPSTSLKYSALLVLAGLAAGAGCSTKIAIVQYPPFYTPEMKTIAVVPFRNQSTGKNAGAIVADKLAAALMANGAYKVFNRNDLKTLMDENDLKIALAEDASAAATTFRKHTSVQAILTGSVTTFSATSNKQQRRDPVYATNRQGRQYIQGYRTYVHTRNEANVSVTAALIRVSDGGTVYATPQPAWSRVASQGSPPRKDPFACCAEAADSVVRQLLVQFAPTRKVIEVNRDEALRTASELYDNKWTFVSNFRPQDEKMYVVLALPPSCDRNRFRLVIVRKGQRQELAAQDIVWSKKYKGFGYTFSPEQIAAKGGPGEYEVKFYSGPEPLIIRPFSIR